MQNKLILFIENNAISVFHKEEGEYKNLKIKGEIFYNYDDTEEGLKFVFEYLTNVLEIEDYTEHELILYHSEKTEEAFTEIEDEFSFGSVVHLEIDVLKTYQQMLKAEFSEVANEYKEKYEKSSKNEIVLSEKLKAEQAKTKAEIKESKDTIDEKDSIIKTLLPKAKKWDAYLKEKQSIIREIVYVDAMYKSLNVIKTNRSKVTEKSIICELTQSEFFRGEGLTPLQSGYVYWLVPYGTNKTIPFSKFKPRKNKLTAIAVISSSPKDTMEDIEKFAQRELNKK